LRSFIRACAVAAIAFAPALAEPQASAQGSIAAGPVAGELRLRTYPERVFFTTANAKEKLSATILILIVEETDGSASTPTNLELIYRKAGTIARTDRLSPPLLQAVEIPDFPPHRLYSAEAAKLVRWPHAYRLMLSLPTRAGVDSIEARLTLRRDGALRSVTAIIPVQTYEPKSSLIFPFRGGGIISQAGGLASGHRNRSGLYAVDALGLNSTYGPMRAAQPDDDPKNYAGWGRQVIAPAAGRIVVARSDRPDQPVAGKADAAYFLPEFPDGGDPGNHVVIDHENGEFSMIAHMQQRSVQVNVGDRVAQGQALGLLGNSGDSSGPHVHYQLQSGPDWQRSDALPVRFTNVQSTDRGSYFTAR
jgi:hypothetical protein